MWLVPCSSLSWSETELMALQSACSWTCILDGNGAITGYQRHHKEALFLLRSPPAQDSLSMCAQSALPNNLPLLGTPSVMSGRQLSKTPMPGEGKKLKAKRALGILKMSWGERSFSSSWQESMKMAPALCRSPRAQSWEKRVPVMMRPLPIPKVPGLFWFLQHFISFTTFSKNLPINFSF